jgi:S-adenosylmethionine:tRNA ribosyltransferase-isomerase
MNNEDFDIEKYNYTLPEEKIAKYPLADRASSKLLLWNRGIISHHLFHQAPNLIPGKTLLVFNDTRVISARLLFEKSTGAQIEIFLLHPEFPTRDIQKSMTLKHTTTWLCMIGNKKKWKDGFLKKKIGLTTLTATLNDKDKNLVRFDWTGEDTFAEIVNASGETPLPPYLKRKPVKDDTERYQTIYSKNNGAVAAPTAGLHFTDEIIQKFHELDIPAEYLTLHVSAGTFKPVEAGDFREHDMHREQILINTASIEQLLRYHQNIIAVGTTSLRILESLYWFGALLNANPDAVFTIGKDLPYKNASAITFEDALKKVLEYCNRHHLSELQGETEIYIYPGYKLRTAIGLFTNFHLPKSTLLLLISVFTNGDWKNIYNEALGNNYRFLSYGDSSLLLR